MFYNKVTLVGIVSKIYPTRLLENKSKRAAIELRVKDGDTEGIAQFIQVICFNKLAQVVEEFINQGDRILIDGQIEIIKYEQNGEIHYATSVVTERIKFLNPKPMEVNK